MTTHSLAEKARTWGRDRALYTNALPPTDERKLMTIRYVKPEAWHDDARAVTQDRVEQRIIMEEAAKAFEETVRR